MTRRGRPERRRPDPQIVGILAQAKLVPEVIDLPECVRKLRGVLEQSVRGDIAIEIAAPSRTIAVKVDPDELEIALLNMTLNARDAMPDGGRIRITVGIEPAESREGIDTAFIEFADTGIGIPDSIPERIFEPFFTTKAVDKGTGLGLSQVYGFVQQSDGSITVSSQTGADATFRIVLPTSREVPRPADPVQSRRSKQVRHGTVLLVEDHPDVSIVAADYLEHSSCKVVFAGSAED
jgi:two-component system, NtrC family, sensor kinase